MVLRGWLGGDVGDPDEWGKRGTLSMHPPACEMHGLSARSGNSAHAHPHVQVSAPQADETAVWPAHVDNAASFEG
eukprot:7107218-Lingulodinium_polyedra.AAC.1